MTFVVTAIHKKSNRHIEFECEGDADVMVLRMFDDIYGIWNYKDIKIVPKEGKKK